MKEVQIKSEVLDDGALEGVDGGCSADDVFGEQICKHCGSGDGYSYQKGKAGLGWHCKNCGENS